MKRGIASEHRDGIEPLPCLPDAYCRRAESGVSKSLASDIPYHTSRWLSPVAQNRTSTDPWKLDYCNHGRAFLGADSGGDEDMQPNEKKVMSSRSRRRRSRLVLYDIRLVLFERCGHIYVHSAVYREGQIFIRQCVVPVAFLIVTKLGNDWVRGRET